ncbi:RNase adapter RapZ [Porticoccaceae bacterium]|nr:RNase adapter RapZ [Porticoccaceae bacterium]MDB4077552.1 RNase adapter RapZ [Porticoccaceae bacterium]
MRLVVISGRSGSGKTSALNILEDVGFTCIDNLPVSLLPDLINKLRSENLQDDLKLAVGIDARNLVGDLSLIPEELELIKARGISVNVLFLQSRRSDLMRRYSETRRKHPLSSSTVSLKEAIDLEKDMLAPIAEIADRNIDTSGLSLHQLRDLIKSTVVPHDTEQMAILFESFGFKRGVPSDADFVFDVRCLPNPHWKLELRALTGNDPEVIEFLESQVDVASMLADIIGFLTRWIPKHQDNNRSYLTVAIGCTGGQHRSVYLANRLAEYFGETYPLVQVVHKQYPTNNSPER